MHDGARDEDNFSLSHPSFPETKQSPQLQTAAPHNSRRDFPAGGGELGALTNAEQLATKQESVSQRSFQLNREWNIHILTQHNTSIIKRVYRNEKKLCERWVCAGDARETTMKVCE